MSFELIRALHIIAVIAWMAGLLMLPRLYAYQCESEPGGELEKKMIEAARRLRVLILSPALIFAFAFGLLLYVQRVPSGAPPLWLGLKVLLALALAGYHGLCVAEGKRLAKGERRRSARFWRLTGEIPMLIAIAVVLLAALEPWAV
ncbi:MAG: CopD family protein [Hydrogenophilaceae bacterium]|jgi:putative membrane protein|nr:CopD family protein [Hydrogenophilaceae bacterium]